jgi:hypothetical protein
MCWICVQYGIIRGMFVHVMRKDWFVCEPVCVGVCAYVRACVRALADVVAHACLRWVQTTIAILTRWQYNMGQGIDSAQICYINIHKHTLKEHINTTLAYIYNVFTNTRLKCGRPQTCWTLVQDLVWRSFIHVCNSFSCFLTHLAAACCRVHMSPHAIISPLNNVEASLLVTRWSR